MKFSTLMILFGFMFTQQVFAQNEGKNTSECYTQNSNNKGCEAANNTTSNQQVQKTVIKTQQKSNNVSKAAEQSSKTAVKTPQKVQNTSKAAVKTPQKVQDTSKSTVKKPQKVQKATAKIPQKTSVKTVSRRSDLVLQTQQQLNRLGFNAGPADGLMGKKTREAIRQFQKKNNSHVDGKSTSTLLDKLKKVSHK